ncbi:GGDEF domain-containing protein [Noviherbaspirillum sp. Root189]|uniref:GGDEF domain-containing protein n=1 Tax=Noviherbaspirillum sp. Root189 TaxID=1736487 RepID=UPI000A856601
MLYCDLDRFKSINDGFGHLEGDYVLRQFAGILRSTFRSSDVLARLGGDEFVVMLTNADPATIDAAMVRVEKEFSAFANLTPRGYPLGCSLGLVSYEGHRLPDLDTMIAAADARMYAMKKRRVQGGVGASTT